MFSPENLKLIALYSGIVGLFVALFLMCSFGKMLRKNRSLISSVLFFFVLLSIFLSVDFWLESWLENEAGFLFAKKIVLIILCLCAAFMLDMLVRFFVWNGIYSDSKGGTAMPRIIKGFISFLIYATTITLVVHFVLQQPVTAVVATSGVAAIILGYSAQSTLGQLFSGLGMNVTRVFEKGDWIKINGETGKVIDTNWRFLTLETYYGNWLTIPNSNVASTDIKNFSQPLPYRGVILPVLVEGGASPERVKEILLKATLDADGVLKEPDAEVAMAQFQDNGILYEIWYYTAEPDEWEVNDQILSGIWYALRRAGISTSLSDVAIRQMPTEEAEPLPISRLTQILKNSEIFARLTDSECAELAGNAIRREVGFPEIIVAQGEASESLYLIEEGDFEINIYGQNHAKKATAGSMGAGGIFGEISLLTGDPSTAQVRARREGVIYEITKDMLRPLFENRPEFVDELGKLMAKRLAETKKILSEQSQNADDDELDTVANRLANQLRSLFDLG